MVWIYQILFSCINFDIDLLIHDRFHLFVCLLATLHKAADRILVQILP